MKSIQKPIVSFLSQPLEKKAKTFSKDHSLSFLSPREVRKFHKDKLIIWLHSDGIFLQDLSLKNSKPFSLDFQAQKKENMSKNLLQRCFSKFDTDYPVYDLTAGFCLDAFLITRLGFEVNAFEKESWLFEFTKEKLLKNKIEKVKLYKKNSLEILSGIDSKSIIYLDPMFGIENKSFAKKEMHFLRKSLFDRSDELIESSLKSKAELIVIKRHKIEKKKISKSPSFELVGKVVTFQIFDRRKG
ncbi:MAG: class I SAM-dependent methyltransferase [Gammaproteobacteria bacterium]|tara:strand:- start:158 stop:886 length:729 start_codon:yes stop_codon:yes gene_type:complete